MPDTHSFSSDHLQVTVKADGAEPVSLQHDGTEMLWQAGPDWKRHAPVLFPIVGRLADDTLRHDGRDHPMSQHGFARDMRFDWLERDGTGCRLLLRSNADTLDRFPFPFALEIGYRIENRTLRVEYTIRNPGDAVLPCSIGAHPAFRWPLAAGLDPASHRLVFERAEPDPIRRVRNGLLTAETHPSPIRGDSLALDPALFAADAVILLPPHNRSLRFEAPDAPVSLVVGWHGTNALGIWSRPGAAFLCIEPWHGFASPDGFNGAFETKPGLMRVAPGGEAVVGWWVEAVPA